MKRIDGAGHVGNLFVTEDVATSRPPTEITADWLNAVQEELCSAIEGAGMVLSGASNNQLLQAIKKLTRLACPPGLMGMTAGTVAPNGWLIADGRAVSRSTYADLFAAIGTTWGAGDGATTFNLPDGRRNFYRGADLGAGFDPMLVVGSYREDQLREHHHLLPASNPTEPMDAAVYGVEHDQPSALTEDWTTSVAMTTRYKTSSVGGTETAPRHAVFLPLISY